MKEGKEVKRTHHFVKSTKQKQLQLSFLWNVKMRLSIFDCHFLCLKQFSHSNVLKFEFSQLKPKRNILNFCNISLCFSPRVFWCPLQFGKGSNIRWKKKLSSTRGTMNNTNLCSVQSSNWSCSLQVFQTH